ncbi:MAG: hypothetical protein MUO26_00155 [Methanotrichaceae archaeon]|nr:hypothetical protein [Methanotrichaceae archaeon]
MEFFIGFVHVESAEWAGPKGKSVGTAANYSEKKGFDQSAIKPNQLPSIISLVPSLDSPQQVGMPIGWQVIASDSDNDTISYRFWLNGPKTNGKWQIQQDWSSKNVWYWRTEEKDAGLSDVRVWIRDDKHANASNMDAFKEYKGYQITQESDNLNVEVANDVYSEKDQYVYYCPQGNIMVVKNRIYLVGSDLDKVKQARYFLHESFNQPEGVSGDPDNNFEIWISTWGNFPIRVIITTENGQQIEKHFLFNFKSKFEEAQREGIPLVEKCGD